ncbi:antirestriction protein ArdA [Pontivivens nitratireducens]|uniref:Antirestriction protein ArdA n=1 Tax=Pontivivens nitratireducens TaxID=2758038 RepID=A0A6G7VM22_9RHOB|nr:antirestriction protein ArdA [Pontibrevibacter nitratireducens]QIK41054.1 antirestriction protein ArdA [Pontibrevibacter nitratireducens]
MILLYAQPYDISACGFYFESAEDYETKAKNNKNDCGQAVEEYEFQFIDGDDIDCALAKAWGINQADFMAYLEAVDSWDESDKYRYIIAVGECGYSHDQVADDPSSVDMTLYELSSMLDLAEQFVEDGLYGEIPENLRFYIDYEAIARDLSMDYSEITIAGTNFIFHCA